MKRVSYPLILVIASLVFTQGALGQVAAPPRGPAAPLPVRSPNDPDPSPPAPGTREVVAILLATDPVAVEALKVRLEREFGLQRSVDYPLASFDGFHLSVFRILGQQPADLVARGMNRITGVIADANDELPIAGDPLASQQFALQALGAERAHGALRGRNVIIGIIDTGVDVGHEDLRGGLSLVETFVEGAPQVSPDVHGTAIAGLIGARRDNNVGIRGMAPEAALLVLQACVPRAPESLPATCLAHRMARAIDRAVILGARILNLSIAGSPNSVVGRLVLQAIHVHDVAVVAAAGNNGHDGVAMHPGAIPGVVAIGATDSRNNLYAYSNRRPHVTLVAPGVGVMSTVPRNRYAPQTGTSFSAAYMTGALALLMEAAPEASPKDLVAAIKTTSIPTATSGVRRIDICRALSSLGKGNLCR